MFKLLLASSSSSWLPVACPKSDSAGPFHRRLKESGVYERLLDRVVEQAKARGLGRGRWLTVDGTKVAADVAIRNQLELIREGRQRLVRALQQVQLDRAAKVCTLAEPLPDAAPTGRRCWRRRAPAARPSWMSLRTWWSRNSGTSPPATGRC